MDSRRLVLAFALSALVFFVWYWLFPPPKPAPPAPPAPQETPVRTEDRSAPLPGSTPPSSPAPAPAAPAQRIAAAAEQRVVLKDGRRQATFTNLGAQLRSMVVPEKLSRASGSLKLELVRERATGPYPYALVDRDLRPHPLDAVLFQAEPGADGRSAVFRYSGPEGVAEKRFRFNEQGLLEAEVHIAGQTGWGVVLGPGIRNPTPEEMKNRLRQRRAVYKTADGVELVDPGKAEEAVEVSGRGLSWIGLEDTYFLSAQVPRSGLDRALLRPVLVETGEDGKPRFLPLPPEDQLSSEQKDLPRELSLILRAGAERMELVSYWGPKELGELRALPYGLDGALAFGKFGFLARPLLAGLHWIHDHVVANYGWAIILMTVLIKIVMLPLTHKQTKSAQKMQELNPKIQGIRDKYRAKLKDKQGRPNLEVQRKMNEEVMAVYKESGVNPAGGCFPLLLQMPVFLAFYSLLADAVELLHAPWILWIQDLSEKDPYYVLPIVMGVTQFLQVRMGPQAGDPMQRRLFQIMPIAMTFLFLGFPSGLVLYWLTNNVLTIVQLQVYNRLKEREA